MRTNLLVARIIVCCGCLLATETAMAQLPQNRLYATFPLGGQVGTAVDLTVVNSADADEVNGLYASHPGITAVQKTQNVNGQVVPVANQFKVKIAENVPPGIYDIRTTGLFGVSNPRSFVVGTRKEIQEIEANNTPETATPIAQATVVNARVGAAGDIDFFKVPAKAGQRLIVECWAKRIDSRLDATIELYDPNGRRVGFSRDEDRGDSLIDYTIPADGDYFVRVYDFLYAGSNDHFYRLNVHSGAYVDYILPPAGVPNTTGEFTVYGRNLPGGQASGVKVRGQELSMLTVKIPVPADATALQPGTYLQPYEASVDGFIYRLPTPNGPANPVLIQFAKSAVALEAEPNNEGAKATKITVPGDVAGQFQARNDVDYFQFDAKAKAVFWIEIFGQRNGTAADPHLIVEQITKDAKGKETVKRITAQDDAGTNLGAQGFDTRTDDPAYRFVAPADGTYRLVVHDRYFEGRGDPRMVYRISIRSEAADFRLVALPRQPVLAANAAALAATWDATLRKGGHTEIEVLAFRKNGYAGAIDVTVAGLPAGVSSAGATIAPGQNSTRLILTSAEDASPWIGPIQVIGKVRIEDAAAVAAEKAAKQKLAAATQTIPGLTKTVTDAEALAKASREKAAVQTKKTTDAHAKAKAAAAKATAGKKALATSQTTVTAAQQKVAVSAKAVQTTSTAFVTAAVAKATADRGADATVAAAAKAVNAKLAAQKAKDAKAEAAADKQIVAAAVAAKLAADAKVAAAAAFEKTVTQKTKATAEKLAADKALLAAVASAKKDAAVAANLAKVATETAAVAKKEIAAKTAADKIATDTTAKAKQAAAGLAQGQKQRADAQAVVKATGEKREAAAKKFQRVARGGTIVWSGSATLTALSRVTRNVTLAVLKEPAPFQVTTGITRMEVSQGAQILVPVKLAKRLGFDNKVDLTFEAGPKNVDLEKKAIAKGKTEQLVRVFVKNNVVPGTYSLHLRGQGVVSYSRNPDAVKRTEDKKQAAIKTATAAVALVTKTTAAKKVTDKQAADAQAAANKAGEALVAADIAVVNAKKTAETATAEQIKANKAAVETASAAKAAVTAQQAAVKGLQAAEAASKTATDAKAKADQAVVEAAKAEQAAKAAAEKAKAALAKKPDDKALQKAKEDAEKAATVAADALKKSQAAQVAANKQAADTAAAVKTATAAKVASDKKVTETAAIAKKAGEAKIAAAKKVTDSATALKTAETAKTVAQKQADDSVAKFKTAQAAKAIADMKVAEATAQSATAEAIKKATEAAAAAAVKTAKAANKTLFSPSNSIAIVVKPAAATLKVTVPNKGALKHGAELKVGVTIARKNGFAGPVKLSLSLPPGITGVSAAEIAIPAGKNQGELIIKAAGKGTEGKLANLVVRVGMDFDGNTFVDEPIAITVSK